MTAEVSQAAARAVTSRGRLEESVAAALGSTAEARWLVEEVAGDRRTVDPDVERAVWAMVDRCRSGEPFQYVLGTWSFRRLDLVVDPRALIPRPETEQVVEAALRTMAEIDPQRAGAGRETDPDGGGPVVVDLGAGTGAIALSLAVELGAAYPGLEVWATDVDADALALAAENVARVTAAHPEARVAERVHLAVGSWFDALPVELAERLALVVSNPPYVAEEEWGGLDPAVWREPRQALVAAAASDGTPGLAGVEAVLAGGVRWLAPGGAAVVELAPHQAAAAAGLARGLGYRQVTVADDLAGRQRALVAYR